MSEPACKRGPQTVEERLWALERACGAERADTARLQKKVRHLAKAFGEHSTTSLARRPGMGVHLRCCVYNRFGTVSGHMGAIEDKFSTI